MIKEILRKFRKFANIGEIYIIAILTVYSLLAIIFWASVEDAPVFLFQNITIIATFIGIVLYVRNKTTIFLKSLRRAMYFLLIYFIYSQIHFYVESANPLFYDDLLIKADRFLFGVDPTKWLHSFSHPILTEYFSIAYFSYFLLPVSLAAEFHLKNEDNKFERFIGILLFSYFASYLLYFFMPAIGPRFTVHEFSMTEVEMPGLFFADAIRGLVNSGGGIPEGTSNPEVWVNRDCMPSGHTWISVILILTAWKERARIRLFIWIAASSLIISTVYLRYHYVVDVIAGIILAILCFKFEPKLHKFILSKLRPSKEN